MEKKQRFTEGCHCTRNISPHPHWRASDFVYVIMTSDRAPNCHVIPQRAETHINVFYCFKRFIIFYSTCRYIIYYTEILLDYYHRPARRVVVVYQYDWRNTVRFDFAALKNWAVRPLFNFVILYTCGRTLRGNYTGNPTYDTLVSATAIAAA